VESRRRRRGRTRVRRDGRGHLVVRRATRRPGSRRDRGREADRRRELRRRGPFARRARRVVVRAPGDPGRPGHAPGQERAHREAANPRRGPHAGMAPGRLLRGDPQRWRNPGPRSGARRIRRAFLRRSARLRPGHSARHRDKPDLHAHRTIPERVSGGKYEVPSAGSPASTRAPCSRRPCSHGPAMP
jgi:hypothetical protein